MFFVEENVPFEKTSCMCVWISSYSKGLIYAKMYPTITALMVNLISPDEPEVIIAGIL